MKGKYLVIVVAFVCLCISPFVAFRQNSSEAGMSPIQKAQVKSPVPWSEVKDIEGGSRFSYNDLWVAVDETVIVKTVNVFTKSAKRNGDDLHLLYWTYVFNKYGAVVVSDMNEIVLTGFFKEKFDPDISYLPPAEHLSVYTDKFAEKHGLKPIEEGTIGFELFYDKQFGVILPWMPGAVMAEVQNPG